MRTLSFILAFACILAGPSAADAVDNSLPGIGAFSYTGPLMNPGQQAMIVAAR